MKILTWKKLISGTLAVFLLLTVALASTGKKQITVSYNNIKIVIDGKEITPKDANGKFVEPFTVDGTTYMPLRAIAEALGKDVFWEGSTNTAYIGKTPESPSPSLSPSPSPATQPPSAPPSWQATVYITPSGQRYHYLSSCAGKNAISIGIDTAISRGFTPCGTCVL